MSELESSTQLNHDLEELSSNNSEIAETSEKTKSSNKRNVITSDSEERIQFPKQKRSKIMRARIIEPSDS